MKEKIFLSLYMSKTMKEIELKKWGKTGKTHQQP